MRLRSYGEERAARYVHLEAATPQNIRCAVALTCNCR
jgi:hypothetical protein